MECQWVPGVTFSCSDMYWSHNFHGFLYFTALPPRGVALLSTWPNGETCCQRSPMKRSRTKHNLSCKEMWNGKTHDTINWSIQFSILQALSCKPNRSKAIKLCQCKATYVQLKQMIRCSVKRTMGMIFFIKPKSGKEMEKPPRTSPQPRPSAGVTSDQLRIVVGILASFPCAFLIGLTLGHEPHLEPWHRQDSLPPLPMK